MSDTKPQNAQDDIELTGEDIIDEPDLEAVEADSAQKIKKLQTALKESESQKMLHLEDLQRTKAEFLNSRKRLEEERIRDKERAVAAHIEKLLPLCDSFQMAMSNTEAWEAIDKDWRSGVEAIHHQLQSLLCEYSVQIIDPTGEQFDPNLHEAMGTEENEAESDTVIRVLQSGYERKGEVIRPAKVILST